MRAKYVLKLFKELPVGTVFAATPSVHAHVWRKVSSRTARIGGHGNGAWFYFGSKERCYVERSEWQAKVRDVPNTNTADTNTADTNASEN